jgi:hypothetical protein
MKTCTRCGRSLTPADFNFERPTRGEGPEHRERTPDHPRRQPCAYCGEAGPVVLQFDAVSPVTKLSSAAEPVRRRIAAVFTLGGPDAA